MSATLSVERPGRNTGLLLWRSYFAVATLTCVLGLVLAIVRIKGIVLPCGSWIGCGISIYRSPQIGGLHLADYAAIFGVASLAAAFGLLFIPTLNAKLLLGTLQSLGFVAAVVSNGYSYVIDEAVCPYCLTYLALTFAGLCCLVLAPASAFRQLRSDLLNGITFGSCVAIGAFFYLHHAMSLVQRTGSLVGVSATDILGAGTFYLGSSKPVAQVVCFYSPGCESCREEIARISSALGSDSDVRFVLRADPPESEKQSALVAADAIDLAAAGRTGDAIRLITSTEAEQERYLRVTKPSGRSLEQVREDMLVAKGLGIKATPTCVLTEGNRASFVDCALVPQGTLSSSVARP